MIYSFQIKVNRYYLLFIRCCSLVEEIYCIWMVWTAAPGEDRLWAQSITRPLWCDDQRVARIVKNDLALASGPCWSQKTMLITGDYTADHKILCWSQGTTLLITGKYNTDDREILRWSQGNILVHTDQREIWFASNSNPRRLLFDPPVPSDEAIIGSDYHIDRHDDDDDNRLWLMMMKKKRQSLDPSTILITTMMMMTIIIIMTKHDEEVSRQSMDPITILIAKSIRLLLTSLPRISLWRAQSTDDNRCLITANLLIILQWMVMRITPFHNHDHRHHDHHHQDHHHHDHHC